MIRASEILRSLSLSFQAQVKSLQDQSAKASSNTTKSLSILISAYQKALLEDFARFIQAAACTTHAYCPSIERLPYELKRWSVFASPFAHRKAISQFERRTWRRNVDIYDMHPQNVDKFIWYVKQNAPADTFIKFTRYDYGEAPSVDGKNDDAKEE